MRNENNDNSFLRGMLVGFIVAILFAFFAVVAFCLYKVIV
jgi:hypothetical protein